MDLFYYPGLNSNPVSIVSGKQGKNDIATVQAISCRIEIMGLNPVKKPGVKIMKIPLQIIVLGITLISSELSVASPVKKDESLIFFPGNAYLDNSTQNWVVPVKGWIFEPEENSSWRKMTIKNLSKFLEIEADTVSSSIYKKRIKMFLVDNERGKKITVELLAKRKTLESSEANGHFQGSVLINQNQIENTANTSWVTYKAMLRDSDPRIFRGKSQLISPQGISVISDIDDTIKISNVRDKQALLKNTFLKPFKAVPGMAEIYQSWADKGASFHYLSASPWQLYPAMEEFIETSGFPEGSFNLKTFRIKDETFFSLFSSQVKYKKPIIEKFFKQYPDRRFILVGDGGEQDPEIFAEIAKKYSSQVLHIFIRDLAPAAENSERYLSSFSDIPSDRWTIFNDENLLPRLKLLDW